MTFTPFLDGMSSWPLLNSISLSHFDEAARMSCKDATDAKLSMQPGQSDENGNADAKADGSHNDGKMMPCPVAHMMLAKMTMPTND